MHPDRQHDVLDKQLINLLRIGKRQTHRASKAGNHDVVDARSGLITQVTNSRRVGIVSNRVQGGTRQIKVQTVMGLVEESDGISFQVIETNLVCPQVVHGRLPAVLPIFVTGKIS